MRKRGSINIPSQIISAACADTTCYYKCFQRCIKGIYISRDIRRFKKLYPIDTVGVILLSINSIYCRLFSQNFFSSILQCLDTLYPIIYLNKYLGTRCLHEVDKLSACCPKPLSLKLFCISSFNSDFKGNNFNPRNHI